MDWIPIISRALPKSFCHPSRSFCRLLILSLRGNRQSRGTLLNSLRLVSDTECSFRVPGSRGFQHLKRTKKSRTRVLQFALILHRRTLSKLFYLGATSLGIQSPEFRSSRRLCFTSSLGRNTGPFYQTKQALHGILPVPLLSTVSSGFDDEFPCRIDTFAGQTIKLLANSGFQDFGIACIKTELDGRGYLIDILAAGS